MRIAFFSPLPPSRSGIADYSQALLSELTGLAGVTTFSSAQQGFDPAAFDIAIYQIGNNAHHDFVYDTALRHPGIVVMHEANLHHLITDVTIRRGDWDAYVEECAYNGGEAARARALRARALEVGPDYEGLDMTRRLLENARGVVVHSQFMVNRLREAGYGGPIARIPHGAWIRDCAAPAMGRNAMRQRLGLDARTPLIGTFGFLKPYKRIAESLRAFRRLSRVDQRAKLILGGEPHPEFPLNQMIESLGLEAHVRVLGFTPPEEFPAYIEACDVVLNLRYPTVGETSGSLLRALGAGKAVLVSNVGAFSELPDEICLKVPVGAGEEDLLFEYLNLLVGRPDLAEAMGARARAWVERECTWSQAAQQYVAFAERVLRGPQAEERAAEIPKKPGDLADHVSPPSNPEFEVYIATWAVNAGSRSYVETHKTRLARTLEITPPGAPEHSILEMGAYMQITPALQTKLGYGSVRGCYFGPAGESHVSSAESTTGERFECRIDLFNAETDRYPYPDESFHTVLCCELIEHLFQDPMFLMSEVNRILKPGGHLVLTTPNIASLRGVEAILQGYHPGFFHAYIKPSESGEVDARHNREYTPEEVHHLLTNSGFDVTLLETGMFREEPRPEQVWIAHLLEHYKLPTALRGDGIYVVGRKTGPVRERWPGWLYS